MNNTPMFRKAGRGFNKDDVNNYIASLNLQLKEAHERFNSLLTESDEKAKEDFETISALKRELEIIDKKDAEIAELKSEIEILKGKISEIASEHEANDKKKDAAYDNLCAKAGEILVIASTTADDILKHANSEADRILSDATSRKDTMLKNISETAESAADGLGDFIRNAVDECIDRINESIRSVSALENTPEEDMPGLEHRNARE